MRTLVSILGHNPIHALIAARQFEVSNIVFIVTEQTYVYVDRLSSLLDRQNNPVSIEKVLVDSAEGISKLTHRIRNTAYSKSGEEYILDITGGQKILAIALWQAFLGSSTATSAVYLNYNGTLLDAESGLELESNLLIHINEHAMLNNSRIASSKWLGTPDELPREYTDQSVVARDVFSEFLKDSRNYQRIFCRKFPNSIKRLPDKWLEHNEWFEELLLYEACNALKGIDNVQVGYGIVFSVGDKAVSGQDEADIVISSKTALLVIEAKARQSSGGAGADLQKRVEKTRRVFGEYAHVIFAHPAWGVRPPEPLNQLCGKNTYLIGTDFEMYKNTIRTALNL